MGVGLIAALPALMGAEGGCTLLQGTLESPVQAITILREHPDGAVDVDLVMISTEGRESRWIDTAQNAELRTPEGELVALVPEQDGHYRAHSDQDPRLVYAPGGVNYRVTFELTDEELAGDAAGDDFIAVVQAPEAEVEFAFTKTPDFAGDTSSIEWSPANLDGLLEVRDSSGEVVFSTFDLRTAEFDGSKWASLIHGGREDLPVDVFADAGTYTVSFCAVASQEGFDEELSSGLGALSGFLAGRCVEDVVLDVAP
ncbi:MAG: hypothetical protein KDK70_32115 [Myxococcales bacterium]|nr:hypothetical protein [Myxococcales bacterium]